MAEEKEKPLTREDVLRLIKENSGTANRLDLSGKVFEENIDLRGFDLRGIILESAVFKFKLPEPSTGEHTKLGEDELLRRMGAHFEEVNLSDAHLRGVKLEEAHLEKASLINSDLEGAFLSHAHLERANLMYANFKRAQLDGAHLEEADLSFADFAGALLGAAQLDGATLAETNLDGTFLYLADLTRAYLSYPIRLSSNTDIQHVNWGNYILGEEINGQFRWAENTYRQLKTWYAEHGRNDIAAKFYYREMEARRKEAGWSWNPNWGRHRLALEILRALFGYGEHWERVFYWMALVIFGSAAAYYVSGELNLLYSLYFSVISFTSLGYGKWVDITPPGWVLALGAFQSFTGVFLMALLLVTFFRKWTR
jgi:uncharacterized protein YjbI with pentapeptide repeats